MVPNSSPSRRVPDRRSSLFFCSTYDGLCVLHFPCAQARLLTAVQTIACRHERALIKDMHDIRDRLRSEPGGQEICEDLPSQFGSIESVRCDQILKTTRDAIFDDRLEASTLHEFDRRVCLPLVHITAKLAVDEFKTRLCALFPDAVDDCDTLAADRSAGFAVLNVQFPLGLRSLRWLNVVYNVYILYTRLGVDNRLT